MLTENSEMLFGTAKCRGFIRVHLVELSRYEVFVRAACRTSSMRAANFYECRKLLGQIEQVLKDNASSSNGKQ